MTDRLPPETRIGMVTLQVADMSRSLAFYQGLLGMTLISRLDERAWLGGGDSIRPLLELREKNGVAPVPSRGRLGLYHFALLLPERGDLARFLAHLTESGIRTAMADHLVSEALYLSDPDGLGVEVYVDRPRGAWRLSNGEYEMATELLDIPDLMSSLAGGVWQGMPSGTSVGHVHLAIDDLSRAADFYQRALGFDTTVTSYPSALFMSAGGYHHHLGTNTWSARAPLANENDARLLGWQLLLPDLASVTAALDRLEQLGGAVNHDDKGGTATDPWNIELYLRAAPSQPSSLPQQGI